MKPGTWPDVARMQRTIREAGYRPMDGVVEMRVTGRLILRSGSLALELDGMQAPTSLAVVGAGEGSGATAQLELLLGQTVELEGRWQPPPPGHSEDGTLRVSAVHPPAPAVERR